MSLFAGMIRFGEGAKALDERTCLSIREALSRGEDPVREFGTDRVYLAGIDIGVFGSPGWIDGEGLHTLCAGHPHFGDCPATAARAEHVRRLQAALSREPDSALRGCRGTFAVCHFDERNGSLILATDRLGARPIHYSEVDGVLYFSSSLRVLEEVEAVPKTLSMRAVVEQAAFGFPLADRTPYSQISIFEGGEALRVSDGSVSRRRYIPASGTPSSVTSASELAGPAYEVFLDAVRLRLTGEEHPQVAFLSGGMDSRTVVMGLLAAGVRPVTVTLGMRGRQDDTYSRRFAEAAGLENHFYEADDEDWGRGILQRVHRRVEMSVSPDNGTRPLWSGDGGSVRIGGVYVEPPLIEALRQGQLTVAAKMITQTRGLPKRVFQPRIRARLEQWLVGSVVGELERLRVEDPASWAMRFFMANDQRRHLHELYENLDLWRFEYQLPFLDGAFYDLVSAAPTELFVGHHFYNEWAKRFPPEYMAVPWQAYRGHEPCPVPDTTPPRDQWSAARSDGFKRGRRARNSTATAMLAGDLPSDILSPVKVWAAIGADSLRMRSMHYVFDAVNRFVDASRVSGGQIDWPGEPRA